MPAGAGVRMASERAQNKSGTSSGAVCVWGSIARHAPRGARAELRYFGVVRVTSSGSRREDRPMIQKMIANAV